MGQPASLGFQLDIGHARVLESLQFYQPDIWITSLSSRIVGVHLHDVMGITDHKAPGLGVIDFEKLANYLPENCYRTLEVVPECTLAELETSLDYLANKNCIVRL